MQQSVVLAHEACNLAKSARLPAWPFAERLYERNEYYIASNHPLKRQLIQQLGETQVKRHAFVARVYREAERVLIHVWPGYSSALVLTNPLAPLDLI